MYHMLSYDHNGIMFTTISITMISYVYNYIYHNAIKEAALACLERAVARHGADRRRL